MISLKIKGDNKMGKYYNLRGLNILERPVLIIDTENGSSNPRHPVFQGKRVLYDLDAIRRTSVMKTRISVTSMFEEDDIVKVTSFEKITTI